ncbi:hypothetical protein CYME_CME124C [Cyanidioschyzon merolae strain 10D]|uniref:Uncharacterized protein n=1 Tax=Cyanidioschyzon merolae (strain NIES-3377 / 10D) TaxID=280699 RepID=M1VFM8_CYAM1|nr:hypothetical protein CYME_CME124C [Cyanidioschyzon merolae strain 10D]BAM79343.1 hypothetical protein CYME_CME124C [Cyanidioschyzon merolae strain 10D]|eukprot:XP_005535629.1 hypothetical protein CYME_CME124C [Cyanidioschyzon merolae strain 10D]
MQGCQVCVCFGTGPRLVRVLSSCSTKTGAVWLRANLLGSRLASAFARVNTTAARLAGRRRPHRSMQRSWLLLKDPGHERTRPERSSVGAWYSRPSAAVERGGGFYVPGLDGPQLRFLLGLTCLFLLALNHFVSADGVDWDVLGQWSALRTSELLATAAAVSLVSVARLEASATRQRESAAETRTELPFATDDFAKGDTAPAPISDATGLNFLVRALANLLEIRVPIVIVLVNGANGEIRLLHASRDVALAVRAEAAVTGASTRVHDYGEIVARVLEAQRGICIANLEELPPEVCFPFLEPGRPGGAIVEPLRGSSGSPVQRLGSGDWLLVIATPIPAALTNTDYRWVRALCH